MFVICDKNKEKIDELYLHDCVFDEFQYHYKKRMIAFECIQSHMNTVHKLYFENVVLFKMQSCSFWHGGNRIMYITLSDPDELLKDLINIQNENMELYGGSYLNKKITYIAVEILINSGDVLTVVCEYIRYSKRTLQNDNTYQLNL